MLLLTPASFGAFPAQDNLFQTGFWGTFKTACGQQAVFFSAVWTAPDTGREYSFPFMLLLRRTAENGIYAYAPKAPSVSIPEEQKGCLLEELAQAARSWLPDGCICLRFDLAWRSAYIESESVRPEIAGLRMNWGTKTGNLYKAPTNHFCTDTIIINLEPSPEQILSKMRQTTRNCIRRSYRSEIDFRICGRERLRSWYALYENTAQRKCFYHEGYDYFDRLFSHKHTQENTLHEPPPETAYKPAVKNKRYNSVIPMNAPTPSPQFYILTAEKKSVLLSGIVLALCGRNAYYLYAGSSLEQRELMPNYGLQWEAIRFARSKGCIWYDLMGIPPKGNIKHPMSGLYIFKTGFGGEHVRFCGTWDFPYDSESYRYFCMEEQLSREHTD